MMKNTSILEEIVNQLPLCERHWIEKYIKNEDMPYDEKNRVRELEKAMLNEQKKWWLSRFPQERAYNQYFCEIIIMNFDVFIQDMRRLLKRNVTIGEVLERSEDFKEEVITKYTNWKQKNLR